MFALFGVEKNKERIKLKKREFQRKINFFMLLQYIKLEKERKKKRKVFSLYFIYLF